jgi:hypothetical protein
LTPCPPQFPHDLPPSSSATVSTTNPTWPDFGLVCGHHGGMPTLTAWAMAQPCHENFCHMAPNLSFVISALFLIWCEY